MTTNEYDRTRETKTFLLAPILALVGLTACGGGSGGPAPATPPGKTPAPNPITPPPAQPAVRLPLAAGKRWLYQVERTSSVRSKSGAASSKFSGKYVLECEKELDRDGTKIWQLRLLILPDGTKGAPSSSVIHLAQDAKGLRIERKKSWRNVYSNAAGQLSSPAFLLAGDPVNASASKVTRGTVTAMGKPVAGIEVEATYSNLGQKYNTFDIQEKRLEQYADGIGMVSGSFNFSKESNYQGISESTRGTIQLLAVDTGPFPEIDREKEANERPEDANTLRPGVAMLGEVSASDDYFFIPSSQTPGIQDLFKFTLTQTTFMNSERLAVSFPGGWAGKQIYLIKVSGGKGQLIHQGPLYPSSPKKINLAAGTYYLGIQCKSSPNGPESYSILFRR